MHVTGTGAPEALRFSADADEAARLAMVERLEAAVSAQPGLSTITAVLDAVNMALQDSSAAVLKRAISAAHVALRCCPVPTSCPPVMEAYSASKMDFSDWGFTYGRSLS